jgi:hypothetical protein
MLAGTLAAGFLSRPLGIVPVFAAQGAGYVLAGLAMTTWLRERSPATSPAVLVPLVADHAGGDGAG